MSLQVWLPLNGNLNNNGVGNYSIVNIGATIDNNGKLGKCYSFNGSGRLADSNSHNYSYPLTVACWIYPTNLSNGTQYIISVNQDTTGSPGHIIGFGFVSGKLCAFVGGNYTPYSTNLSNNIWYHITVIIDINKNWSLWINGLKVQNGTCGNPPASKWFTIGARCDSSTGGVGGANYYFQGKINDVRLYDHALSDKEVKELSKGLILHYPLNGNSRSNENLFRDSAFNISGLSGGSSDLSTTLGYYNGAASNHTFENGIDTILLNSTSNIGINFKCKATDINLDSSAYYTISCEAKCSKSGATLDIGLSYYNNSNSWVWRGGTNSQSFNAVDTWQKFKLTFKPDSDTQYIGYCFTCKSGDNNTLMLKNCKLEKGSVATPWMPNKDDVEYSALGYNSNIEFDISGNSCNGIYNGTFSYSINSAKHIVSTIFNGTNSYIEADSLPTETKTISVWLKTSWSSTTDTKSAINDKNSKLAIVFWKNNTLLTYVDTAAGGSGSAVLTTNKYIANKWNHIVVVSTGSNTRNVYINGELISPTSNNWTYNNLTKLFIGARNYNGYSGYFDGQLSDFRAYATALTADDVKELYNASNLLT